MSFGTVGGFQYNPWATLPYLQLPGWTVTGVYVVVLSLFALYGIVLLGSYIPGVSDFFDTISSKYNSAKLIPPVNQRYILFNVEIMFIMPMLAMI